SLLFTNPRSRVGEGVKREKGWCALPDSSTLRLSGAKTGVSQMLRGVTIPSWDGAPCTIRTCDLLVRSQEERGNWGQQEAAALRFCWLVSPPETNPDNSRRPWFVCRLSVELSCMVSDFIDTAPSIRSCQN